MSKVDLSALRMQPQAAKPARRPLGPRLWTLAFVLLAAVVALTFVWPLLVPPRVVPMARVRAGEAAASTASTAAEAVGWVEADPFPVAVRPLVGGRIESIEVIEGAEVQAGKTVIARLESAELSTEYAVVQAEVLEAHRAFALADAEHALAQARFRQNAERRAAVAAAEVELHATEARAARAGGAVGKAEAAVREADAAVSAQERLRQAGASNELALERARAAQAGAAAERDAAVTEQDAMLAEVAARRAQVQLLTELREDPVDLAGAMRVAQEAAARTFAARQVAETKAAMMKKQLDWTTVLAPVTGRVMRRDAVPGDAAGPEHPPIVLIYDPQRLRARIDVPLGSVGGIRERQEVELRSESTGNVVVRGFVHRIVHESDLLKNTLQVHVGLVDAPALLRPETLVRARFLAEATTGTSGPSSFRVPRAAVTGGLVFVFDPVTHTARAVAVTAVGEVEGDVLVTGELSVAQQVVLVPVEPGERIEEQQR